MLYRREERRTRESVAERGCRPGRIGLPVGPGLVPPAVACVEFARDSRAFGTDLDHLPGREPAFLDASCEQLFVLPLPRAVERDPDVELQILRVVADARAPERLLDVHVPAGEDPSRPAPEEP